MGKSNLPVSIITATQNAKIRGSQVQGPPGLWSEYKGRLSDLEKWKNKNGIQKYLSVQHMPSMYRALCIIHSIANKTCFFGQFLQ